MLRKLIVASSAAGTLFAIACSSSDQQASDQATADASSAGPGPDASSASASSASSGQGGGPASSAASTGGSSSAGGSGGSGTGGSGGFVPAPHPAVPQVVTLGGAVLATPKVVAITYDADPNQADVDAFTNEVAGSTYWTAIASEYGVAQLSVLPPVHVAGAVPAVIKESTLLANLAANTTGANPPWGAVDPNALYAFIIPENANFNDGTMNNACCGSYYGYHYETTVNGTPIAYAIVCSCTGDMNFTTLDNLTSTFAHELVEAATDPFIDSNPAYAQTDDNDLGWTAVTEGEVADMCQQDIDAYPILPGMTYAVQRSWSNAAALAGHDPCVPAAPYPYFNSSTEAPDVINMNLYGNAVQTNGVKILVGQQRTIDVSLWSDAPTGPWTLTAWDLNEYYGGNPHLMFSWDVASGSNGDVRKLTITVLTKDKQYGAEPFLIESDINDEQNFWMGVVGN